MAAQATEVERVLVVDDEPQVRAALARLLRQHGVESVLAASAEEALALSEGERLRAVIADVHMPGMGGIALLRRLSPIQPAARFVVLTGSRVSGDVLPRGHGVQVLTKPWDDDALIAAVLHVGSAPSTLPPRLDRDESTHVLLVEDDPADALLVRSALTVTGGDFEIARVQSVNEACALLEREHFDVACTELHLPDSEGLEALFQLQDSAPSLGVVVLSRDDDPALALEAIQAGAQDFLVKGEASSMAIANALRYAHERKQAELRLSELAFRDPLTSLENRTAFRQSVAKAAATARKRNGSFAVLLLDMDRFKAINDALGHDGGDAFLKEVGNRLSRVTRGSDSAARLGGDEFALVIEPLTDKGELDRICQRVLRELRAPFVVNGTQVSSSGSIGAAMYPDAGLDSDALLAAADAAMYVSKAHGRDAAHVHGVELKPEVEERLELERQLAESVRQREFELFYQPQVAVDGTWSGAEALLRWRRRPGRNGAADFIPVLEESGLIGDLGSWIIKSACQEFQAWRRQGCSIARVSVNLSARQFVGGNLVREITRIADECGMPPQALELELTERTLLEDSVGIPRQLEQLARSGFRIALDDFGTGSCSLNYLRQLPISTVKLDKSLVHDATRSEPARDLLGAIIQFSLRLRLHVVAEGVECARQHQLLRAEGCHAMQGFHLHAPLAPAEFGWSLTERLMPATLASVVSL